MLAHGRSFRSPGDQIDPVINTIRRTISQHDGLNRLFGPVDPASESVRCEGREGPDRVLHLGQWTGRWTR